MGSLKMTVGYVEQEKKLFAIQFRLFKFLSYESVDSKLWISLIFISSIDSEEGLTQLKNCWKKWWTNNLQFPQSVIFHQLSWNLKIVVDGWELELTIILSWSIHRGRLEPENELEIEENVNVGPINDIDHSIITH